MFTATLRLRMATAHQATDPLAFDKGELPHRHPRAERMVRLAATPLGDTRLPASLPDGAPRRR